MDQAWVLVGLIVVLFLVAAYARGRNKRLMEAKAAYQQSLTRLKHNPTDADLKQQTLALGRAYSNLTREQKGVTLFDEVALSNDINAACAGASIKSDQTNFPQSADVRLSKLADLKTKGLISDDEYQTQRRKILDNL